MMLLLQALATPTKAPSHRAHLDTGNRPGLYTPISAKESRPVAGAASLMAGGASRPGGPQSAAAKRSALSGRFPYSA